jgi:predicted transposase YbfD/YdcC
MSTSAFGLPKFLKPLKDPRINRCKRHSLGDIITMALCAVLGGADSWKDIATFARHRKEWFQRFLTLPNGIPSHHTFRRVFNRLEPRAFQTGLIAWLHSVSDTLDIGHIAIDGKTLRHSGGGTSSLRQLHMVSAWATEARLILGQVATEEKSNEITAIPELLEMLDLKGALVTIDAMGCQKNIAKKIVEKGGDYLLAVKDNQEKLKEDILDCFVKAYDEDCQNVTYQKHTVEEKGNGREETRVYEVISNPKGIRNQAAWPKLEVIVKCYSERKVQGKTTSEERYYIGSRRRTAKRFGSVLRNHWGIENNLHWQLDVNFGEDASRIQDRNGGQNFDLLRKLALNLLQHHPSKESVRTKRYEATLDISFMEEILKK